MTQTTSPLSSYYKVTFYLAGVKCTSEDMKLIAATSFALIADQLADVKSEITYSNHNH